MSRMTKFLRQTCVLEIAMIDKDGESILNEFGEYQYEAPKRVKCRHERSHRDVQTTDGSIVRSTSRYYLDGSVSIKAGDRLDGKVVVSVTDCINGLGLSEGYEVYV